MLCSTSLWLHFDMRAVVLVRSLRSYFVCFLLYYRWFLTRQGRGGEATDKVYSLLWQKSLFTRIWLAIFSSLTRVDGINARLGPNTQHQRHVRTRTCRQPPGVVL